MNIKLHAHYARQLIAACGGVDAAGVACGKSKSTLSRYQRADNDQMMPADVLAKLELFCGQAIYSTAIAQQLGPQPSKDFGGDVIALNSDTADIVSKAHQALTDGKIDAAECAELLSELGDAEKTIRDLIKNLTDLAPAFVNVTPLLATKDKAK